MNKNKQDVIQEIARKTKSNKSQASLIINHLLDDIQSTLNQGGSKKE